MITIEDNDLPITAAQKLICGTKPNNPNELQRCLAKVTLGDETALDTQDMFSFDEINEIAQYLLVYCNARQDD